MKSGLKERRVIVKVSVVLCGSGLSKYALVHTRARVEARDIL